MDKVKKYGAIIMAYLTEYVKPYTESDDESVETQIIADKERHHYQLVRVGWQGEHFFHYCLFHFVIKDGKIWIQKNNTEELVAEELVKMGIPPSDIVVGFKPKEVRKYTGFAVG